MPENTIDTVFSSAYLVYNIKHNVKILYGCVEEDNSNRFNLGSNVSTSQVLKIHKNVFTTKNSTYLVRKIDDIIVCEREFKLILKGVHPHDAAFVSAISEQSNNTKH